MHRKSILRAAPCDLKKLPIGALEAFVLSLVHGDSLAEDVAETAGLEVPELLKVARHLADLGALTVDGEPRKTKRPTVAPSKKRHTVHPAHASGRDILVPAASIPRPRSARDLRTLGIGPREGFVLSQIDGKTSVADLGEITGLSTADLGGALRALEEAGVIDLGRPKRRSSATLKAARQPTPAKSTPAVTLSDACELPQADRTRITEMGARLETADLYGVLGIERDADIKAIRRAYHEQAKQFHPDRFFGKKLGQFRRPLERIFMRLTLAYDTLSMRTKRAEYDQTLPPQSRRRGPTQKPPEPAKRTPTVKPQAQPANRGHTNKPPQPSRRPPAPKPSLKPIPMSQPARKSARPAAPATAEPQAKPAYMNQRLPQDHVEVFVRAAREALERDDVVSAANHYRLAVQCSDDPALRAALADTDAKARKRVRETSLAGARAAEQAERWGEAAAKYAKALGVLPEAWIAERGANAMRLACGDLRAAARLGEQAVLAEPHNAAYRVTLGEIYLDAGLLARASGEAERAVALAPADARASALAKRVARAKQA